MVSIVYYACNLPFVNLFSIKKGGFMVQHIISMTLLKCFM